MVSYPASVKVLAKAVERLRPSFSSLYALANMGHRRASVNLFLGWKTRGLAPGPSTVTLLLDCDCGDFDLRSANQSCHLNRGSRGLGVRHERLIDLVHLGHIIQAGNEHS